MAAFLRDVRILAGASQPASKPALSIIKPTASGFRCDLPKINAGKLKRLEEFLAELLNGEA